MKLIDSKTEKDFRKELIKLHNYHFSDESKFQLKTVLETSGHSIKNAYILHSFPDETEDIYRVLIDGSYLVNVTIDRINKTFKPIIENQSLESYSKGLRRMD